jgi:hypothetical protein
MYILSTFKYLVCGFLVDGMHRLTFGYAVSWHWIGHHQSILINHFLCYVLQVTVRVLSDEKRDWLRAHRFADR